VRHDRRCVTANDVMPCPNCGKKNRVPAAAKGTPRCANCHESLPWIADADDQSFGDVVNSSKVPVLLDLWAPWCGPCRVVSPALETLARENAGAVKLVKVNVDEAPGIAQRFSAQSIPTLVVLRQGEVVARQIGAAPEPQLRQWLRAALVG
jgi:thioredoxin 2